MPAAPGTIGNRREDGTVIKTRNPALRYELTAKITRHYRKVSKVKTETKTNQKIHVMWRNRKYIWK